MITVNTNVVSLTAQRNLNISQSLYQKSIERLSSGLRINRAADDAAGLAISEGLTSLVNGFEVAARNANDGVSLLQTAEGAMVETSSMLNRMRSLSVQAANGTLNPQNRQDLQKEVNELLNEITRIGNTATFNGQNLLDGSFAGQSLQIGALANQTISISLSDLRSSTLGQVAIATGGVTTTALAAGDLLVNTVDTGTTVGKQYDTVSFASADASAISVTAAINSVYGQTGVKATANAATKTLTNVIAGGAVTAGQVLINGVSIGAVTVAANDSDGALRNAINAKTNQTGVAATVAGNKLVLTSSDGRNVTLNTTNTTVAGYLGGATTESLGTYMGTVTVVSNSAIQFAGAAETSAGFTDNQSVAVDPNTAINKIDISTITGAQSAITRLDAALSQLNTKRAQIGAYQNRLTSTINNLNVSKENTAAAKSRILDADFASETAALTKAQILQQAGTAVLAQANMAPQAALSLLK
ncbi:MAG: flagellin [Candidatus Sumerlaeota bacterium]|nr:flagellin [Candidatus Sumerlaeota bacterium]